MTEFLTANSTLVIATHNPGKFHEFHTLLAAQGWTSLGLADLSIQTKCEETGVSFRENACIKALAYSRLTDLPVLADDSGLEVPALADQPGIHSARYAGPYATDRDNISKLLVELQKTGGDRRARFVCALALAHNEALLIEAEGICEGEILAEARGDRGFGYDPVFFLPGLGRTYAELEEEEKNRLSHRARAVERLLAKIGDRSLFAVRSQLKDWDG